MRAGASDGAFAHIPRHLTTSAPRSRPPAALRRVRRSFRTTRFMTRPTVRTAKAAASSFVSARHVPRQVGGFCLAWQCCRFTVPAIPPVGSHRPPATSVYGNDGFGPVSRPCGPAGAPHRPHTVRPHPRAPSHCVSAGVPATTVVFVRKSPWPCPTPPHPPAAARWGRHHPTRGTMTC